MAGPSSSDVPDRYDVVFSLNDGTTYGFLYADSVESNLPFRTHKALYSYSPTFLERQNVSNTYGDNFQDFFLTGTQADFSEGEQQRFFRVNDQDSVRKYWAGLNVDPVTVAGNVTLTPVLTSISQSGVVGVTNPINSGANLSWYTADGTNVYGITSTGVVSTVGAHGLTATPTCMTSDVNNIFLGSENSGSLGIRKLVTGTSTFTTFSSTKCSQLAFLNNILYGYQESSNSLISFDTSGTATTQFQWKNADGTNPGGTNGGADTRMIPYGGSMYIARSGVQYELWVYDGAGCRILGSFPPDFTLTDICVSQGIVYAGGYSTVNNGSTPNSQRAQVYYYSNGSIGKLWESKSPASTGSVKLCAFGNGIVFYDCSSSLFYQYDLAVGGTHAIAKQTGSFVSLLPNAGTSAFLALKSTTAYAFNITSLYASTGYVQTSQYDFDNTLSKVFRGIKIDADIPANSSVDIAYQVDGCGGTYTSLQTGASSGTEYFLPANTQGHSISVRVTLNSATGSATPTLKHVYVRAAPILQQFRRREYLFDLSSGTRDEIGQTGRRTRDGFAYSQDAITACNNLAKIATQTIPFTVYDRFVPGGMTVMADLQQNQAGYDGFAIYEVHPNVFIGRLNLREV